MSTPEIESVKMVEWLNDNKLFASLSVYIVKSHRTEWHVGNGKVVVYTDLPTFDIYQSFPLDLFRAASASERHMVLELLELHQVYRIAFKLKQDEHEPSHGETVH